VNSFLNRLGTVVCLVPQARRPPLDFRSMSLDQFSRRDFLKFSSASLSSITFHAVDIPPLPSSSADRPLELPALPYPYNGVDPRISESIMRANHVAHFATYVNNLNVVIVALPLSTSKTIKDGSSLIKI